MSIESETNRTDRDIISAQLLEEASQRFNLEEVAETEELYRTIQDIQTFAESGVNGEIEYETENDVDFEKLQEFLILKFGELLLSEALISRVTVCPDIVHLNIGKGLYLTLEEYRGWLSENPRVADFKVRAENFTTFQTTGWLKENFGVDSVPLPILIYSFEGEQLKDKDYLESLPENERSVAYKFGTVSHEIGHHLFSLLLKPEQRNEFQALCESEQSLTQYSSHYKKKKVYAEEQFCEAVRLITTNPAYLQQKSEVIFNWLTSNFPELVKSS